MEDFSKSSPTSSERELIMRFNRVFALCALAFPRLAGIFVLLFTGRVTIAFHDTKLLPILGITFLPFTTLMYVFVYNPVTGVSGWAWFWVMLGFILDVIDYYGSAYTIRMRWNYFFRGGPKY